MKARNSATSTAPGKRRRVTTIGLIVVGMIMGTGGTVLAGHQFSDVGDTHPFHDEISAIAGAGVTTGFPDGTYRPGSNVTRQAMAAFMERGFGRAGYAADFTTIGNDVDGLGTAQPSAPVAAVTIDAGATQAGNGFVVLQGAWTAYADGSTTGCPCDVAGVISDGTDFSFPTYDDVLATLTGSGFANAAGANSWVVPIAADESKTYTLYVLVNDLDVNAIGAEGSLTATYVPFGPDGDSTLSHEASATATVSSADGTSPRRKKHPAE